MVKRKFEVSRIFPLGSYKNITLTNGIELDEEPEDPVMVIDQLTKEIHTAFENYRQYLKSLKGEE
jgi:hypothetical protein